MYCVLLLLLCTVIHIHSSSDLYQEVDTDSDHPLAGQYHGEGGQAALPVPRHVRGEGERGDGGASPPPLGVPQSGQGGENEYFFINVLNFGNC